MSISPEMQAFLQANAAGANAGYAPIPAPPTTTYQGNVAPQAAPPGPEQTFPSAAPAPVPTAPAAAWQPAPQAQQAETVAPHVPQVSAPTGQPVPMALPAMAPPAADLQQAIEASAPVEPEPAPKAAPKTRGPGRPSKASEAATAALISARASIIGLGMSMSRTPAEIETYLDLLTGGAS